MKFFLDANIPYSALVAFKELKHEAVHAKDAGLNRATDREISEYALGNECVLVTKDLEFANPLLFPAGTHYGLVLVRLPPGFKASHFVAVLKDFLKSVDVKALEKSVAIVKLGSYRIRRVRAGA